MINVTIECAFMEQEILDILNGNIFGNFDFHFSQPHILRFRPNSSLSGSYSDDSDERGRHCRCHGWYRDCSRKSSNSNRDPLLKTVCARLMGYNSTRMSSLCRKDKGGAGLPNDKLQLQLVISLNGSSGSSENDLCLLSVTLTAVCVTGVSIVLTHNLSCGNARMYKSSQTQCLVQYLSKSQSQMWWPLWPQSASLNWYKSEPQPQNQLLPQNQFQPRLQSQFQLRLLSQSQSQSQFETLRDKNMSQPVYVYVMNAGACFARLTQLQRLYKLYFVTVKNIKNISTLLIKGVRE